MVAKPLKTKGKLPISRHPLFAPMVALWFAALFGLGSLAIRPTLLESAVLALRLDLVVPAAAPPLGFTFRILLALSLFVIGGTIGFVLARRMTRDKAPQGEGFRFSRAKAKVETPAPVVVDDIDEDDDFNRLASARRIESETANPLPGRRRALAMEEDFSTEVHDVAPLPGHQPQILDLADLGSFDVEEHHEPAVAESAAPETVEDDQEPQFDPWNRHPSATHFVPAAAAEDVADESVETETGPATFAAPFAANADFSRPQASNGEPARNFGAPIFAAPGTFAEPPNFAAPASFAAPQVFDAPQDRACAAPFAAHAPFSESLTSGPDDFEPANDEAAPAGDIATEAEFAAASVDFSAPAPAAPEFAAAPAEQVACTLDAAPARPVFGTVSGDAAERLVSTPLTSLGVVQLAERLALAIARKRDGAAVESKESAGQPEAVAEFSAPLPPVPVAFPVPPSLTPPPAMVFAPPAPVADVEDDEVEAEEAPAPSLFRGIPAALRPISLDDHADDEPLPSILPPRAFPKLPEQVAAEEPAAPAVPQSFVPPAEETPASDASGETENYASLLEMKTPPRAFVRIEEPETESAEIEPVVIFPGQDSRQSFGAPVNGSAQYVNGSAQNANGFAQNGHEPAMNGASRLFDGPLVPNAAMRVPPAMARSIDAEETERQLKAALATLQRMSGAA